MKASTKRIILICLALLVGATCSIFAEAYIAKAISKELAISATDFSMGGGGY